MPFIDFTIGQVLTADQMDLVMRQSVMRFADSATRDTALTEVLAEGMMAYLDDTNEVLKYDGTDWIDISGDITGVTAGTALTGGGTSGNVTLNVDLSAITIPTSQINDITATASELNTLDGITATTAELNTLDGVTATSAELNFTDGVTSNIQTQLDAKASTTHATTHELGGTDELSLDGSQVSDATPTAVGVVKGSTTSSITALGIDALSSNTTGLANVAVGDGALSANTTGTNNVAVGRDALSTHTNRRFNTAVGDLALRDNVIEHNVAMGFGAAVNVTTGPDNTIIGSSAAGGLTTGADNTIMGRDAGDNLVTGSNNLILGNTAEPSSSGVSSEITLGNSSISTLRCNQTSISSLSDERDKTNIQDSPLGLDLIQRLRPVTFDWDRRDGSFAGMKDVGFIAQDVVQVEDELDIEDTLKMSSRNNPEKLEIAPARLIPVLTKAVQELSEQNADLKARLDKLEGK